MKYIKESKVRKRVNSLGKRAGRDFLLQLDIMIEQKVKQACEVHNGGKKTLDESIAVYVGIAEK